MIYLPSPKRYSYKNFKRCGKSGLDLPQITLGLWHNFGGKKINTESKKMIFRAFDRGVTHFDLANNYGPPPGSAESNFGKIISKELRKYRDELIISSKAGYDMWPGPYGEWGSKKYITASLDQSLKRMNLDYVDIFYSHRFDPNTPLEETMGALDQIVRSGKALYVGISSYNSEKTRQAEKILKELGTPCLIHQPSYNLFNRWVEEDNLLGTLNDLGIGSIAFTPLAQGMLTNKYLNKIPAKSRANQGKSLDKDKITPELIQALNELNDIAANRGQSLAQMSIAWVLRNGNVTTALIGASKSEQVEDCVGAVKNLDFNAAELLQIDAIASDQGINLWAKSSETDS